MINDQLAMVNEQSAVKKEEWTMGN